MTPFLYKFSLVLVMAAHGADLASTEHCLGAGRCREMNPLLVRFDQPVAFGAAKMGVAGVSVLAVDRLHKTHPKLAVIVNLGIASAFGAIAARNARISGQEGKR
jgi:hypothetical protein